MARKKSGKKRTISPEHLAKLQEGRRKAYEAKHGIVTDKSLSERFRKGVYQVEHRNDEE